MLRLQRTVLLCFIMSALSLLLISPAFAQTEKKLPKVSFTKQIAPILASKCLACHNQKKDEGSYRLDTFALLKQQGETEELPLVAGKPEKSLLYQLIIHKDVDVRMPKDADALADKEIKLLKQWISEGAMFDGPDTKATLLSLVPKKPHPKAPEKYRTPIPITAVAISPDGKEVFVGGYNEVTVWDSSSGKLLRRIGNLPQRIYSIQLTADGKAMSVTGGSPSMQGEAVLVDPRKGKIIRVLGKSNDVILDAKFAPDGSKIATAAADRAIRIYETKTGKLLHKIEHHADWVMGVAFSADGKLLASASRDKTAKVFDVASGKLLSTYSNHSKSVFSVAFHPKNQMIFSAGKDRKIELWTIKDSKFKSDIRNANGDIFKLIGSDKYLLSCASDKLIRLFDANNSNLLKTFKGHQEFVFAIALNPKTMRVVSGGFDGEVRGCGTWIAAKLLLNLLLHRAINQKRITRRSNNSYRR